MQTIDVIKAAARNLYDLVVDGVPASLTASTIDHLSLIQPLPHELLGAYHYIYSGAGAGQERVVGSFNATNRRLCFAQGFGSIPSINSNFILTRKYPKSQYDNMLQRAIGNLRARNLGEKVATLSLVATQYEYPVPSGMEYISTLRLVPSGNTDYAADDVVDSVYELPPRLWRIERVTGGSYVISIDPRKFNLDAYDNYICRVNGQSKPDIAGTDNANVPVEFEEYLIAMTSMLMTSLPEKPDARFTIYKDMVKGTSGNPGLEDYVTSYPRGKRVGS